MIRIIDDIFLVWYIDSLSVRLRGKIDCLNDRLLDENLVDKIIKDWFDEDWLIGSIKVDLLVVMDDRFNDLWHDRLID